MKDYIYKNLGLRKISLNNDKKLNKSLIKFFNLNQIDNFNPYYSLFSNNIEFKTFNNKFKLLQLIKKKKKIHINGYIYKSLIGFKNSKNFKSTFIKECPYFNILLLDRSLELNTNSYDNYQIFKNIYDLNSQTNVELFVTYLTSKLNELNICPNFCIFYGFKNVVQKKYSIEIDNNDLTHLNNEIEKMEQKKLLNSNKCVKNNFKIYKNNGKLYLERYNIPTAIIATEKLEEFYTYIRQINISNNEWKSYIFQVIFSLCIIQKVFGLLHNDLHICNLMYRNTEKKYLFYKINNKYFKIPTYNKIIKIIDWGRSTFNFKNLECKNDIFNSEGDVFGQYIFKRINISGKKPIIPNPSTDLAILSANLISENTFPKNNKLYDFVKSWLKTDDNYVKNLDFSFDMYKEISKNCHYAIPINIINNKIFDLFIINFNDIPKGSIIYSC